MRQGATLSSLDGAQGATLCQVLLRDGVQECLTGRQHRWGADGRSVFVFSILARARESRAIRCDRIYSRLAFNKV